MSQELVAPFWRRVAAPIALGATVLYGCSGGHEAKPTATSSHIEAATTQGVSACDTEALPCDAQLLNLPELAQQPLTHVQNLNVMGHTTHILYLGDQLHERYQAIAAPLLRMTFATAAAYGQFRYVDPNNVQVSWIPKPSNVLNHKLLLAPASLPLPRDFPPQQKLLAVTHTPVNDPALHSETVSIVGETVAADRTYPGDSQFIGTLASLATELCQGHIAIEPNDLSPQSPLYPERRRLGQELYCVSFGNAVGAAVAGIDYGTYARKTRGAVQQYGKDQVSLLIYQPEIYASMQQFASGVH